jgi:hypothetical protein
MQTLKIGSTTYKVRPERTNLFELIGKCHKKPRVKTEKARSFPQFTQGMSTSEYVRLYFLKNEAVFGAYSTAIYDQYVLNDAPCALYEGEDAYWEEESLLAA